jgi:hypothetical protein
MSFNINILAEILRHTCGKRSMMVVVTNGCTRCTAMRHAFASSVLLAWQAILLCLLFSGFLVTRKSLGDKGVDWLLWCTFSNPIYQVRTVHVGRGSWGRGRRDSLSRLPALSSPGRH